MSYLIDTNVISELRNGPRCDARVARWWEAVAEEEVFLSVLVIGEMRRGIALARRRDPTKAVVLEAWLDELRVAFGARLLPVTSAVADACGRMAALRPVPVIDALLAATAIVHGLTLVTRNIADVEGLGIEVCNPFD